MNPNTKSIVELQIKIILQIKNLGVRPTGTGGQAHEVCIRNCLFD